MNKSRRNQVSTIAIAGLSKAVGVTHLGLTMANYFNSRLGYKVIYIELAQISSLLNVVKGKKIYLFDSAGYEYKGVRYIFADNINEVKRVLLYTKEIVIVDINDLNSDSMEIFNMCESRYILGNLAPWCSRDYSTAIENLKKKIDIKQVRLMTFNYIKEKDIYNLGAKYQIKNIPFIHNPFKLKESEFSAIEEVIV